jgi:hypothetical protein
MSVVGTWNVNVRGGRIVSFHARIVCTDGKIMPFPPQFIFCVSHSKENPPALEKNSVSATDVPMYEFPPFC